MYTNLWANTQRDCMTFSDQQFPAGTTDFPFRTQILDYLRNYGKAVRHLVDFNKEVIRVEKHGKWSLTVRNLEDPKKETHIVQFDAVAVASGMVLN
jgi:cation diffusion facilitator CzcD-associated flavoprotein CzcO